MKAMAPATSSLRPVAVDLFRGAGGLSYGMQAGRHSDLRRDYNEVRPHSSLKGRSSKEYAESVTALYQPLTLIAG